MNNNVLVMREEELEAFTEGLKQTQSQFDSTSSELPTKLGYMKRSDLFNRGIDKIARQTNSISNSILNVSWMMQEHNKKFFNVERNLAKAASKIEIPNNFAINDSLVVNVVSSMDLVKDDGRSINEGQALEEIENVKDSSIKQEQRLEDITSSLNLKEEKLNENTVISKEELGNINNDNGKETQEIDDSTTVSKKDVENINNNVSQTEQQINTTTNIVTNNLENINNSNRLENETDLELKDEKLEQINNLISDINSNNDNLKSFSDLNDNGLGMKGI